MPALSAAAGGIGAATQFDATLERQVVGLMRKRVALAVNDFKTVPLILVPVAAATAGFVCGAEKVFGRNPALSNIAVTAIVMGGMIPLQGLIAEAVDAERATKLRNVLTVMGATCARTGSARCSAT